MPVYELNDRTPVIGKGSFVAPGSAIIGNVIIGENVYIGFGAVLRGDFGKIIIGDNSVIEDYVVIHCAKECIVGSNAIIGHMAMIHNARLGNWTLTGMQSLVSDNAVIEDWSIVAEKSFVRKGQVVKSEKIFGGIPAVETGRIEERHREMLRLGIAAYGELTQQCRTGLKSIEHSR